MLSINTLGLLWSFQQKLLQPVIRSFLPLSPRKESSGLEFCLLLGRTLGARASDEEERRKEQAGILHLHAQGLAEISCVVFTELPLVLYYSVVEADRVPRSKSGLAQLPPQPSNLSSNLGLVLLKVCGPPNSEGQQQHLGTS